MHGHHPRGLRERTAGERRLALTPETCRSAGRGGRACLRIERGAGAGIGVKSTTPFAGPAQLVADADALALSEADVVFCVQPPSANHRRDKAGRGAGQFAAARCRPAAPTPCARAASSRSLERLPRTTARPTMDVLSSQAGAGRLQRTT